MREVLISIQPKWIEKIASGEKTVEVRKTRPKCEVPFKCYIYCTKGKPTFTQSAFCDDISNGKVIGEFVCDKIDKIFQCNSGWVQEHACISREEYFKYLGLPYNSHFDSKGAYAWHITDLVVYDEPRELSDFEKPCICKGEYEGEQYCDCLNCELAGDSDYGIIACNRKLKRPFQSWGYVEATEPRQTAD